MRLWMSVVVALTLFATLPSSAAAQRDGSYVAFPETTLGGPYFVTQQYRDLLDREPDPDGLSFWTAQLEEGLEPHLMVEAFVDSAEFAGRREPVARLYLAAFGRLPDDGGWRYWTDQLAAGASLDAIATEFIASPEGARRFGAADAEFINQLYVNALGRPADEEGSRYWLGQFAAGVPKSIMLLSFSDSREFRTRSAPVIRASLLYTGLLGRTPDSEGLQFWSDQLAGGGPFSSAVAGFLEGAEYRQRLRSTWCQVADPADIAIFDGPSPPDFTPAYDRMQLNGDSIGQATAPGPYDEVTGFALDPFPDHQFVITVQRDRIASVCLEFLRHAPHPEQVTFRAGPWFNSDLDEVAIALRDGDGPLGSIGIGIGGDTGLNLRFTSQAVPEIDAFMEIYGDRVSELTVGSFPYPMPSPLPESVCIASAPNEVTALELGLDITVDLPSEPAPAGSEIVGSFTVTNQSSATYTLSWGAEVTAYLGSGQESVSVFNGFRTLPLTVAVIEPGESTSAPLGVGTDSCDSSVGHRLPPGTYELWGHVSILEGNDPFGNLNDSRPLRLPATPLTVTN